MKAKATIKREIRAMRRLIDSGAGTLLERRLAYLMESTLRWVVEDVRGWPTRIRDVHETAHLIQSETK